MWFVFFHWVPGSISLPTCCGMSSPEGIIYFMSCQWTRMKSVPPRTASQNDLDHFAAWANGHTGTWFWAMVSLPLSPACPHRPTIEARRKLEDPLLTRLPFQQKPKSQVSLGPSILAFMHCVEPSEINGSSSSKQIAATVPWANNLTEAVTHLEFDSWTERRHTNEARKQNTTLERPLYSMSPVVSLSSCFKEPFNLMQDFISTWCQNIVCISFHSSILSHTVDALVRKTLCWRKC